MEEIAPGYSPRITASLFLIQDSQSLEPVVQIRRPNLMYSKRAALYVKYLIIYRRTGLTLITIRRKNIITISHILKRVYCAVLQNIITPLPSLAHLY